MIIRLKLNTLFGVILVCGLLMSSTTGLELSIQNQGGTEVLVGATRQYNCILSGAPNISDATLEWTRDGVPIPDSRFTSLMMMSGTQDYFSALTLVDIELSDTGSYKCSVMSPFYNLSTSIGIIVQELPVAVLAESDIRVKIGNRLVLNCTSTSQPPPLFIWRFNDSILTSQDGVYTKESVTEEDEGEYTCTASNTNGGGDAIATVTVFRPASMPTNLSIDDTVMVSDNTTQIAIKWDDPLQPGKPKFSNFTITVSLTDGKESDTFETDGNSFLLRNLYPGTTYMIQVFAVSFFEDMTVETSPGSLKLTYKTVETMPDISCSDISTSDGGKVSVRWLQVQTGGEALSVDEIVIKYALNSSSLDFKKVKDMVPSGVSEVEITGDFVAGQVYRFQITAINTAQLTETETCGDIVIEEGIPSQPTVPIDMTNSDGKVIVYLSTQYSGAGETKSFEFVVEIHRTDDAESSPSTQRFPFPDYRDGENVFVTLRNIYGGNYKVKVYASNVYGDSAPSEFSRIISVQAQPPRLDNLAIAFEEDTFTLTWEFSEDPLSPLYQLFLNLMYGDEMETFQKKKESLDINGNIVTLEVKPNKIENETDYYFSIVAENEAGWKGNTIENNYTVILEPTVSSSEVSTVYCSASLLFALLATLYAFCVV